MDSQPEQEAVAQMHQLHMQPCALTSRNPVVLILAWSVRNELILKTFIRSDGQKLLCSLPNTTSAKTPLVDYDPMQDLYACSCCHHHKSAVSQKYTCCERGYADNNGWAAMPPEVHRHVLLAAQDQDSNQGQQAPEDMQDVAQPAKWETLIAKPAHSVQQQTPKRPAGTCASIAQRSVPEIAPEMVRACHHTMAVLQR